MNTLSATYLIFLPIVAALFYLLPTRFRVGFLVVISLGFYISFAPTLFFVLPAYIALGYLGGLALQKGRGQGVLVIAIIIATAGLCYYKYATLFLPEDIEILLPIGISYYTFSTVGYLADIVTGATKPEKNLLKYSLFIGFFPQLIAGPIPRTDTLLAELEKPLTFDYQKTAEGLFILCLGYAKKLCVAIPLGLLIAPIFSDETVGGGVLFLAALLFTLQLYFDFAGYTDIARGTAQIFGITLAPNFKQPFYSTNFSAFWSRWHISLSKWLQDYIFTPLVWNRPLSKLPFIGRFFQNTPLYSTIFILFVISGVWHGAGLTFLIWGLLQAVFRIGEEILHKTLGKPKKKQKPATMWAKRAVVFLLFSFSLVFFRAESIDEAFGVLGRIVSIPTVDLSLFYDAASGYNAEPIIAAGYLCFAIISTVLLLLLDHLVFTKNRTEQQLVCTSRGRWVLYYIIIAFCLVGFLLNNGGYGSSASFIYGGF